MFEVTGDEVIDIVNKNITDENKKIQSKFAVIIEVSKKARELVDEKDQRLEYNNPISVAINDFKTGNTTL